MSELTYIQCHFVKGMINHRLRFGRPVKMLKLDKYRNLAFFEPGQMFGYIRWRANEYGTQDWRFYILKTGTGIYQTKVPGIAPAVIALGAFIGTEPVRNALKAFDEIEAAAKNGAESVPESYWRTFCSALLARQAVRSLPGHYRYEELNCAE